MSRQIKHWAIITEEEAKELLRKAKLMGFTELAARMGLSHASFYSKIRGLGKFTRSELFMLKDIMKNV